MANPYHLVTKADFQEAMIGIIYARLSTRRQEQGGISLDTQVEGCLERAEEVNVRIPSQNIMREQGSGADPQRPMFRMLNTAIQNGHIDALFLYSPDRYTREPLYAEMLSEMCGASGVEIYVVQGTSGAPSF